MIGKIDHTFRCQECHAECHDIISEERYVGQTIEQVVTDEHGKNYLQWAAENHPQKRVKDLCKTWVDTQTVA